GIYVCLLVGAVFLVVHMVLGYMVEPRIMGLRMVMSNLVVFLSFLVWGLLLGPVGMLVAVTLNSVGKIRMENTLGGSQRAIQLGPGR
ncbi:AI-2E family transporter, partial [Klebsiella variicola]|uniref:AI-2E family transporter n=1 Tax=Klebsiella variicola TaxID=244366 RepID=UPI0039C37D5E